jgi:hypothetical protein
MKEEIAAGDNEIKVDLSDVPAGVYFCTLKIDEGMETVKVVVF